MTMISKVVGSSTLRRLANKSSFRSMSVSYLNDSYSQSSSRTFLASSAAGLLTLACTAGIATSQSEVKINEAKLEKDWNQFHVESLNYAEDEDNDDESEDGDDDEDVRELPVLRLTDVAKHDGQSSKDIWMTYGGMVYDVTNFIPSHPGGSEKIMQAAGKSVEPFWNLYRQHFSSDLPMQYMEKMKVVGTLHEDDQAFVDTELEEAQKNDPYAKDPIRHPVLIMHGEQPANAEVPYKLLTENYITPNELFYIRSHQPVPYLTPKEIEDFRLRVNVGNGKVVELSMEELKNFPKTEFVVTLQCSGNRRAGFNDVARTSGTGWYQGAISTAKWGGVRLRDILQHCGIGEEEYDAHANSHVEFSSMDDFQVSIGFTKAFEKSGDVLIAYEMNGETLPRDHGFPLRAIVPGYIGVRNCKWLKEISVNPEQADSPYQRGLNYKILPPGVMDAKGVDLSKFPSMYEASVFSGITQANLDLDSHSVVVKGWAWAGGGRNVARVDVTLDNGQTWTPANIEQGGDQPFGKAWAWVFWSVKVPISDSTSNEPITVASKAVDVAYNSQPEDCRHMWNLRGLSNNSWFRFKVDR